jgi:AcrR family transcriptional regulator
LSRPVPSSGRTALIEAAERLVAERGIHAVSVREVVLAADQRNNSAVTYHFGSRQGLLDAVWALRSGPINVRRAQLLAEAQRAAPPRLEDLVRAYVVPLIEEIDSRTPSYWARFNEQWLIAVRLEFLEHDQSGSALEVGMVEEGAREAVAVLMSLFDAIAEALPDLDAADRRRRITHMSRFVITTLASIEREAATHPEQALPAAAATDEIVGLAIALLRAPATSASR